MIDGEPLHVPLFWEHGSDPVDRISGGGDAAVPHQRPIGIGSPSDPVFARHGSDPDGRDPVSMPNREAFGRLFDHCSFLVPIGWFVFWVLKLRSPPYLNSMPNDFFGRRGKHEVLFLFFPLSVLKFVNDQVLAIKLRSCPPN